MSAWRALISEPSKIPGEPWYRALTSVGTGIVRGEQPEVPVERKQVEVLGQPVTYKVTGPEWGEPVVLVHGLAGSTRWWVKTIPALADSYRVYLVDLPGFGSMRRFPGGFVLEDAATWLVACMEALSLNRVHLVGHSMGGYISLNVAAHKPESVGCLVLVDPAGVPTGRPVHGHVWPLITESLFTSPKLVPVLVRDVLRAGPRTLLRASLDLLARDVREDLHAVCVPTLLIWGEKDALVPLSLGYVLRQEVSGSSLFVIPGAHHVPMLESPELFNRALLAYLSGSPVGG